jgi:hypothetical protein
VLWKKVIEALPELVSVLPFIDEVLATHFRVVSGEAI